MNRHHRRVGCVVRGMNGKIRNVVTSDSTGSPSCEKALGRLIKLYRGARIIQHGTTTSTHTVFVNRLQIVPLSTVRLLLLLLLLLLMLMLLLLHRVDICIRVDVGIRIWCCVGIRICVWIRIRVWIRICVGIRINVHALLLLLLLVVVVVASLLWCILLSVICHKTNKGICFFTLLDSCGQVTTPPEEVIC